MILSGLAVQTKGLGSSLVSSMKRLMAAWRSATERKAPRLRRRLESLAALDGVQPGAGGGREMEGPARMAVQPGADLGVFVVSRMAWMTLPAGTARSPAPRKRTNS